MTYCTLTDFYDIISYIVTLLTYYILFWTNDIRIHSQCLVSVLNIFLKRVEEKNLVRSKMEIQVLNTERAHVYYQCSGINQINLN